LSPRRLTTIALLVALVPLLGWWLYGLFDLDEGFYAAVVGEMNRRHEWVTPYYNGQPWFEKPILLYWLAKPSLAVFGDMIGPRLPSIICAFGTYLLAAWYARRRLSEAAATLSVVVLGSSLLFVAVGRLMMTDLPLVIAFSKAMLLFWESLVGDRRWRLATAFLLGVAVLAKGPVALILFALIAGWTYWREPGLRPAFRGYWLAGTAILAAVIAAWYVPAYLASGHLFVQKFLIEQNIGRFTGGDAAHTIHAAWAYILYIPVLLVGMAPWIFFLGKAWPRRSLPSESPKEVESDPFRRYLAAWAAIVFLFFSASSAKLPHYVLPVCVPVAILIGDYLARKWGEVTPKRLALPLAWTLVIAVLAQGGFMWWYEKSGQREAHELARYVRQNSILGVPETIALFQLPRRDKDLGTGKPKLQETSLPSMLLYLDTTVKEAETVEQVADANVHWLFTRSGRITPAVQDQFTAKGLSLQPSGPKEENFELYELKPSVGR